MSPITQAHLLLQTRKGKQEKENSDLYIPRTLIVDLLNVNTWL